MPVTFLLQSVDVGEVAVGASEVDAVPHYELVGHLEAHVLDGQIYLSARRLTRSAQISREAGLRASRERLR
jgi:hypothetical protein